MAMLDPLGQFTAVAGAAVLAAVGGAVAYLRRRVPFSWAAFGIEMLAASFVGVVTLWGCEAGGITGPAAAVAIATAGHSAGVILNAMQRKAKQAAGAQPTDVGKL